MRNKPFHTKIFGIDLYIPTSGLVGFFLISYFALPTSMYLTDSQNVNLLVLSVAMFHAFAIYLTIFVHELGHVVAAKILKQDVEGIHLHLFGGHTAFARKFESAKIQFWTAFTGPLFSGLVALFSYYLVNITDASTKSFMTWLMWSCIAITFVNLLPGTPLDGGQVLSSLVWKLTNNESKGAVVAGYGGYFVAALWMSSPFLFQIIFDWEVTEIDIFFSTLVGVWLFMNARFAIKLAKSPRIDRESFSILHELKLRDLARRAISVNSSTSLKDALVEMQLASAGSLLVEQDGEIIGIVHEKYLENASENEKNKTVAELAVKTRKHEWINFNEPVMHNEKIDSSFIHGQWVVVDDAGAIYGVVHHSDVAERLKVLK